MPMIDEDNTIRFTLDGIREREKNEEILDDVMYDVVKRISGRASNEY